MEGQAVLHLQSGLGCLEHIWAGRDHLEVLLHY